MTDPRSQRDNAARQARRWELLHQLERQGGDLAEAVVEEIRRLDEADEQYFGRLLNEVEVDLALRRGRIGMQHEDMRATLAIIPEDHPARQVLERLLVKLENNEQLTPDDLDVLRRVGGDD